MVHLVRKTIIASKHGSEFHLKNEKQQKTPLHHAKGVNEKNYNVFATKLKQRL